MLLQILNYLRREGIASNQQLAREFNLDLMALEPMLDIWLKRGIIAFCQNEVHCQKSCLKNCHKQAVVYYRIT
ncbi:FeoC like transcriptional regulator [Legionella busanensis]|uniref:FeoC like transcriptional regulator n=1 Tax=Legionella busanensis TaxID=190655 RepID=A0A378JN93_9GAMM|nr:FeoC-like transcriptional regulator [Legionella busanensis]STX52724.1 FeoC like transcriptional regulator [Legionella busanensis]